MVRLPLGRRPGAAAARRSHGTVVAAAGLLALGCGQVPTVRLIVRVAGDERKTPLRNPGTATTRGSDVEFLILVAYNPTSGATSEPVRKTNDFFPACDNCSQPIEVGRLDVAPGPGWRALLTGVDRDEKLYSLGRSATFEVPKEGSVPVPLVFGIADDFAASAKLAGGLGPFASVHALVDGTVLLIGLAGARVHDPKTGTVCDDCLAGDLPPPRFLHVAASLPDGKVFIAGGFDPAGTPLSDAYLFDGDRAFGRLALAGLPARGASAVAVLGAGRVLIAGGQGAAPGDGSSVVLVDPGAGTVAPAAALAGPVIFATATTLANGDVLVAGGLSPAGSPSAATAVYPADGSSAKAAAPMRTARGVHSATLLADGNVLIIGGRDADGARLAAPEVYSAKAGTFLNLISDGTPSIRAGHVAIALESGDVRHVLLAGGDPEPGGIPDPGRLVGAQRFVPAGEVGGRYTGKFESAGQLVARTGAAAAVLADSSVLVAGGARTAADPKTPRVAAVDWLESLDLFVPCATKDRACPR